MSERMSCLPLQVLTVVARSLATRYKQLKPFQRKFAVYATAVELLKTLDFLNVYQRQEIMFRTNSSKDTLAPDLAWRRMKLIEREIKMHILPKVKEVLEDDDNKNKSHDDVCDIVLQKMYEESKPSGSSDKPDRPPMWEFNHNNIFTVYRIYYSGTELDPDIFVATPPKVVQVPLKKPENERSPDPEGGPSLNVGDMTIGAGSLGDDDRRAMLKEVKDHTDLLVHFEGVIPEEQIVKRKRELWLALPPAPPPMKLSAAMASIGAEAGKRKRGKKAKGTRDLEVTEV